MQTNRRAKPFLAKVLRDRSRPAFRRPLRGCSCLPHRCLPRRTRLSWACSLFVPWLPCSAFPVPHEVRRVSFPRHSDVLRIEREWNPIERISSLSQVDKTALTTTKYGLFSTMYITRVTASLRTAQAESLNRSNPSSNARMYCRTGTFFCCTSAVHSCRQC